MIEPPRISCILPVFNGEKYIEEAVYSILGQTFKNFELIIINDGSWDGTAEIIDGFAERDARVVVIHKDNGGIVDALNSGLARAKGHYFARMDADDISLPCRFAFQSNYLDRNPACAIVGGYAETFNDNNSNCGIATGGWRSRTNLANFPPKVAVAVHPLIMMRTEILRSMGGYRKGFPHAEDYDLYIRAVRFGEIHNPPVTVLRYRVQPDSMSAKHTETQEWAALAAEFSALGLVLPSPPPEAVITAPVAPDPAGSKILPVETAHAYFWFRVWRRRRGFKTGAPALGRFLPFLVGTKLSAWEPHYGLPLRCRIIGSMLLHSRPASRVTLWLRQR